VLAALGLGMADGLLLNWRVAEPARAARHQRAVVNTNTLGDDAKI
jgi:hypothetical protein